MNKAESLWLLNSLRQDGASRRDPNSRKGFIIGLSPKLYSCHLASMLLITPAAASLVNLRSSNVGAGLSTLGYTSCLPAGLPSTLSCLFLWLSVIIFIPARSAWATNAIGLENLYELAYS